jgi:hypothetical protein
MMIALGYLPLDNKIFQETFIALLETEIIKLEKDHPNWRKFSNYVIRTYVDFNGQLGPQGKIKIKINENLASWVLKTTRRSGAE